MIICLKNFLKENLMGAGGIPPPTPPPLYARGLTYFNTSIIILLIVDLSVVDLSLVKSLVNCKVVINKLLN